MATVVTSSVRRRASRLTVALAAAALLAACGTPSEPGALEPDEPGTEAPDPLPEDQEGEDQEPDTEDPDTEDPDTEDPDTEDPVEDAGPQPDPAAMEDPCAAHEGREGDAFIDVVSPVQDQVVPASSVELVGCSNVFEATVAYELYSGDGELLDGGFTTAECGTGCVGAFRETVSLVAAEGEPVVLLQVFSENQADEGERQLSLVEVQLVLE
jgi:hypothetical protein